MSRSFKRWEFPVLRRGRLEPHSGRTGSCACVPETERAEDEEEPRGVFGCILLYGMSPTVALCDSDVPDNIYNLLHVINAWLTLLFVPETGEHQVWGSCRRRERDQRDDQKTQGTVYHEGDLRRGSWLHFFLAIQKKFHYIFFVVSTIVNSRVLSLVLANQKSWPRMRLLLPLWREFSRYCWLVALRMFHIFRVAVFFVKLYNHSWLMFSLTTTRTWTTTLCDPTQRSIAAGSLTM